MRQLLGFDSLDRPGCESSRQQLLTISVKPPIFIICAQDPEQTGTVEAGRVQSPPPEVIIFKEDYIYDSKDCKCYSRESC